MKKNSSILLILFVAFVPVRAATTLATVTKTNTILDADSLIMGSGTYTWGFRAGQLRTNFINSAANTNLIDSRVNSAAVSHYLNFGNFTNTAGGAPFQGEDGQGYRIWGPSTNQTMITNGALSVGFNIASNLGAHVITTNLTRTDFLYARVARTNTSNGGAGASPSFYLLCAQSPFPLDGGIWDNMFHIELTGAGVINVQLWTNSVQSQIGTYTVSPAWANDGVPRLIGFSFGDNVMNFFGDGINFRLTNSSINTFRPSYGAPAYLSWEQYHSTSPTNVNFLWRQTDLGFGNHAALAGLMPEFARIRDGNAGTLSPTNRFQSGVIGKPIQEHELWTVANGVRAIAFKVSSNGYAGFGMSRTPGLLTEPRAPIHTIGYPPDGDGPAAIYDTISGGGSYSPYLLFRRDQTNLWELGVTGSGGAATPALFRLNSSGAVGNVTTWDRATGELVHNYNLSVLGSGRFSGSVGTTNGFYAHTNSFSAANIIAGMTNGSFWFGVISNAYQAAWMSNNVTLWKKLAP